MPASNQTLPRRLAAVQRRLQQWRGQPTKGRRIPEALWKAAVEAAQEFGLHPTAKALGLDYYSLKHRLDEIVADAAVPSTPSNSFVELVPPLAANTPECLLELEDASGTKMRLHCKGLTAADLTALSRSVWGAR